MYKGNIPNCPSSVVDGITVYDATDKFDYKYEERWISGGTDPVGQVNPITLECVFIVDGDIRHNSCPICDDYGRLLPEFDTPEKIKKEIKLKWDTQSLCGRDHFKWQHLQNVLNALTVALAKANRRTIYHIFKIKGSHVKVRGPGEFFTLDFDNGKYYDLESAVVDAKRSRDTCVVKVDSDVLWQDHG